MPAKDERVFLKRIRFNFLVISEMPEKAKRDIFLNKEMTRVYACEGPGVI